MTSKGKTQKNIATRQKLGGLACSLLTSLFLRKSNQSSVTLILGNCYKPYTLTAAFLATL